MVDRNDVRRAAERRHLHEDREAHTHPFVLLLVQLDAPGDGGLPLAQWTQRCYTSGPMTQEVRDIATVLRQTAVKLEAMKGM